MWQGLNRLIDRYVMIASLRTNKFCRRMEYTYSTTYRFWLMYLAKRSKDMGVKITMWTLLYCTFSICR
jgi:hypothetical protein